MKTSFNEVLYQKRMEKGMSKKAFAKFLGVPTLFYRYYENGYVKPGKKYIERISDKLDIDYSLNFVGAASYPSELPERMTRFEKWYRTLLSKLWVKIVFVVFLLLSIATIGVSFSKNNEITTHADQFYSEKYLQFISEVRENGTMTFSLLHELTRPEIHISDDEKYVSISASSETFALRDINAYIRYKGDNSSLYYIVPNSATGALSYLSVQYIDYVTLEKYISTFNIVDSKFVFSNEIRMEDGNTLDAASDLYPTIKEKMLSKIDHVNSDFNTLIKEKTGMEYDFYGELLVDHKEGANKNLFAEIMSLTMGIIGIGLTGLFLFAILFSFFFGIKEEKKKLELERVDAKVNDEGSDNARGSPEKVTAKQKENIAMMKKDIPFFPFLPETVLEIIGICLIALGSVRIFLNLEMLFYSSGVTQEMYNQTSTNLFRLFTVGMFLLYFIDFDIFLDDSRSLRNFFLYGIVFFGLYFIECILIEYLSKTRGLIFILRDYYVVPNNFGTISCYFGIMFFLFYTPKGINTKKKTVIFRLLSLIPIAWILVSSVIFENYKAFGLEFNTWQLYFFDSERPQFSLLCVSYLVGLYLIRLYFKKKYGEEAARRFFNGNRFYYIKNIFICLIVTAIAVNEYCLRNYTSNIKGIGSYYQIVYLIPLLLFYHPHLGKRCKPLDYFTLILYGLFFSFGYLLAAILILAMVLR